MDTVDQAVFPFGLPVVKLFQTDRTPKKVFILGVYSGTVQARWLERSGKILARALPVASEPELYWCGDQERAEQIIKSINIPEELGLLIPEGKEINGPIGRSLDKLFLEPLGVIRQDSWLCDMIPFSLMNRGQRKAIKRYSRLIAGSSLLPSSVPSTELKIQLVDSSRREEILAEINESKAEILISLGDLPLKMFLSHHGLEKVRLADYSIYGRLHPIKLGDREIQLLPLIHPRDTLRESGYATRWFEYHKRWLEKDAKELFKNI